MGADKGYTLFDLIFGVPDAGLGEEWGHLK